MLFVQFKFSPHGSMGILASSISVHPIRREYIITIPSFRGAKMSQEKDKVFFRNFSLIVGALVVMMVIFIIMARIFGVDDSAELENQSASVAERTAPVGEVNVAGAEEQAAPAVTEVAAAGDGDAGKKIYDGLCAACHGSGIPGIPQLGDKEAWAPRLAQGNDTLYANAIDGFTGSSGMMMPPRGGGTGSDDEVKAAVDYMISNSQLHDLQ